MLRIRANEHRFACLNWDPFLVSNCTIDETSGHLFCHLGLQANIAPSAERSPFDDREAPQPAYLCLQQVRDWWN